MSTVPNGYASPLRARLSDLLKIRPGRAPASLGAYEKVRIERILNKVNTGRMTLDDAQQAIGTAWKAAYGPARRSWLARLRTVFEI